MRASSQYQSAPDDPAPGMRSRASGALALGLFAGTALLAATIWWVGDVTHTQPSGAPANPLQVVDPVRALVFDAEPATGDVRVLNVRSGISEIARLHDAQRGHITTLSLDAPGHVLTVETDTGRYRYDAFGFQLLRREPLLAVAPGPAAD
jgi:hypothetical protein